MRQADIVFALGLLGLAGLVAWESLALNIGWGINGPEGGFFPFWLAVGLGLCSLVILGQALWHAAPTLHKPLVAPGGWVPLLTVAIPAIAPWSLSLHALASTQPPPSIWPFTCDGLVGTAGLWSWR
jgi:hypothetical protein